MDLLAKKKKRENPVDSDDTPIVSDGRIEEAAPMDEPPTPVGSVASQVSVSCSGLIHPALFKAVPMPWVSKNDEHAVFGMTLDEKYLDGKVFMGAITVRGSFVNRKETQLLL